MTIVKDIMNSQIFSIGQDKLVIDAVQELISRNVGALAVTDSGGKLIGIFSERDLLKRVVGKNQDPKKTSIKSVMSSPVMTIPDEASIGEAMVKMSDNHIRHLPVVNAKAAFVGMLGIREVATSLAQIQIDLLMEGKN